MKRDNRIVNLRALAIVLVVFGHSIILYQDAWSIYSTTESVPILNVIKRGIDLIQMPLFFSLSGYLFTYKCYEEKLLNLIIKKTKRLLVPFICFALFWMIPIRLHIKYPGYVNKSFADILLNGIIAGNDCGHLWFLPCLFLCFLGTFIVLRVFTYFHDKREQNILFVFWVSWVVGYFFWIIPKFWGSEVLRAFAINWIWFCAGMVLCSWKGIVDNLRRQKVVFGIVCMVCLCGYIMNYMHFERIVKLLLLLTVYLFVSDKESKLTRTLDKNSFGIYLFHSPLVYITYSLIPNANPIIVVVVNFFVFGTISMVLTHFMRTIRLSAFIGE